MEVTTAYLITNPDPATKTMIQRVGGQWSFPVKGYFLTQEQKDRIDSGDIPEPTLPSGIIIEELIGDWRISGNTWDHKDRIKQLGGRWNPSVRAWEISTEKKINGKLVEYDDIIIALS